VPLERLADITAGMTGSDLRDLVVCAAYRPVREHVNRYGADLARGNTDAGADDTLRPLNFDDFVQAAKEVTIFLDP